MSLLCPKCRNVMHRYERAGVVVDQCAECKGLFLDRGELEKLVEAETGWYVDDDDREGHRPEPRYEALYEARPRYDEDPRHDPPRRSDDDQHRYSKRQLRRSFLEELFG
jgi:Zn-finger nucleic acid-binding protein